MVGVNRRWRARDQCPARQPTLNVVSLRPRGTETYSCWQRSMVTFPNYDSKKHAFRT